MKRKDVMEIVGLVLALAGFVALVYGLSVLAEWLAYVFGGVMALAVGASMMYAANQTGGAS